MNFSINKNKKYKLFKTQRSGCGITLLKLDFSSIDAWKDVVDGGEDFPLKAINSMHPILFFSLFSMISNNPHLLW